MLKQKKYFIKYRLYFKDYINLTCEFFYQNNIQISFKLFNHALFTQTEVTFLFKIFYRRITKFLQQATEIFLIKKSLIFTLKKILINLSI